MDSDGVAVTRDRRSLLDRRKDDESPELVERKNPRRSLRKNR